MNILKKVLAIVLAILLIPTIVSSVITSTIKFENTDFTFDSTNTTTNVTPEILSEQLNLMNKYNTFRSLLIDDTDTNSNNYHFELEKHQLVKNGVLPSNLSTNDLYFKVYNDEFFEVNNNPYEIETGLTPDKLSRDEITELKGLYWYGNDIITAPTSTINFSGSSSQIAVGTQLVGIPGSYVYRSALSSNIIVNSNMLYHRFSSQDNILYNFTTNTWSIDSAKVIVFGFNNNINNVDFTNWLYDNGTFYSIKNLKDFNFTFNAGMDNQTLTQTSPISVSSLNFTSNGNNYTAMVTSNTTELKFNTTLVFNGLNSLYWNLVNPNYRFIKITDNRDIINTGSDLYSVYLFLANGKLEKTKPVYNTPTLVYDLTPLINNKVYSPLNETTFDQLDESQILSQMLEWYNQNINFNQFTNDEGVQMVITVEGNILVLDTGGTEKAITINYDKPVKNNSLWAVLLFYVPLIFISGTLLFAYNSMNNKKD